MLRRSALLAIVLIAAVMPFDASAATSQTIRVTASGQSSTNWYFYSSSCSTQGSHVTYMHRGGPSFRASGITPTSGAVYEYFDAVGSSVWGKAYFFEESSPDRAFDFYFEGTLHCFGRTYGIVRGSWTFGYLYATDPATGQLSCTRLDGRGTVEVRVDFLRKSTQTILSGSYTQGTTQLC